MMSGPGRRERLTGSCVSGVEAFDVIAGCRLAVGGARKRVESRICLLDGGSVEQRGGAIFDPRGQAAVEDISGHGGFEFRAADEKDEGMNAVFRHAEELRQGFDMEVVLMEWILEAVLGSIDLLGPLALLFGTEDPAFVVFRFNDEDAESGHDHMVELGGALAIRAGEIDVVELAVELRIQAVQTPADHPLADPAFDAGRCEDFEKDIKAEQHGQAGPVGKERIEKREVGHGGSLSDPAADRRPEDNAMT